MMTACDVSQYQMRVRFLLDFFPTYIFNENQFNFLLFSSCRWVRLQSHGRFSTKLPNLLPTSFSIRATWRNYSSTRSQLPWWIESVRMSCRRCRSASSMWYVCRCTKFCRKHFHGFRLYTRRRSRIAITGRIWPKRVRKRVWGLAGEVNINFILWFCVFFLSSRNGPHVDWPWHDRSADWGICCR